MFAHKYRCSWKSEQGTGYPGAKVTGSCELCYVGAVNPIWVLSKSSMYS